MRRRTARKAAIPTRRGLLAGLAAVAAMLASLSAPAQDRIKVVATFSILGDLARNVGGDRVEVAVLVGPNSDVHVYSPTPADAKKVGGANLVVVNGLGLEGWMARLVEASGTKAPTVVASRGIRPRKMEEEDHPGHMVTDPHAWQSIANAKVYVANIRDGLSKADPAGKATYEANAAAYLAELDALEREVNAAIARIPADHRKVITTHDAFSYFGDAYHMQFISPEGVSTDSEPSAKDVAKIINQLKRRKIPAVFMENIVDPRMMRQIAKETGAKIGGTLYSDALTDAKGEAPTYIDMVRHNIRQLTAALGSD